MAVACIATDAFSASSGTSATRFFGFGGAGRLALLAIVHSQSAATVADISSITGPQFTAAPVKLRTTAFSTIASPSHKTELWYGTTVTGGATMTVTLAAAMTGFRCQIYEFTGVDLTVGTNGIVQTTSNHGDNGTAMSVGMNGFADTTNAGFAVYGIDSTGTTTPKSGWTELVDSALAAGPQAIETQFRASADNTPSGTAAAAVNWGMVAVELSGFGVTALAAKASVASNAKQGVVLQYR